MNKKGFTLVELMAVIAIIAVLGVAAVTGVNAIIEGQKTKVATQSEETISESALSKYTDNNNLYLPACMDDSGYINMDEVILKKINNDLRDQMAFENKKTENDKISFIKQYTNNLNSNDTLKNNFAIKYFPGLKDKNCFKLTSVADLIAEGYLKDLDNGCDKASLVIVYKRGDSSNQAGTLDTAKETGICKGSSTEEKGPIITVTPERDLSTTAKKTIKVTVTANLSDLDTRASSTLTYGWSRSLRRRPDSWKHTSLTGNKKKLTATITKSGLDEEYYLWVQAGCIKDNKKYSNPIFATGPYSFLAAPTITYVSDYYDASFGRYGRNNRRCNTETTCNGNKRTVIYGKEYGLNEEGNNVGLCTPSCRGYRFDKWDYNGNEITANTIVGNKKAHNLTAKYTARKYDVTYDSNGGSSCSPNKKTVTYDEKYGDLCNPKREGHTFAGWWTSRTGGTQIKSDDYVDITSPIIIYAHWDAIKFNVAYNGNGSTSGSVPSHQCTYGGTCNLANNGFTRTNYTFNGWKKDNTGNALKPGTNISKVTNVANATVTYYAQWCPNCVTPSHGSCTLNANTPGTCTYTTKCDAGYGINRNGTYNPTCTQIYNIKYDYNGGTKSGSGYPDKYTYGVGATINGVPTRAGYKFNGWIMDGSTKFTQTISTTATGDKNVKANWCQECDSVEHGKCTLTASTAGTCTYTTSCDTGYHYSSGANTRSPVCVINTYTVKIGFQSTHIKSLKYGSTSHTTTITKTVNYGTKITISAISKDYHHFTRWSDGDTTKTNRSIIVTRDLNLVAQGVCNKATAHYYRNGGIIQSNNALHIPTNKPDPIKTTTFCAETVHTFWSPWDYTANGSNLYMIKKNKKNKICKSKEQYVIKRYGTSTVLNSALDEHRGINNSPRSDFFNYISSGLKNELKTGDVDIAFYPQWNC